MMMNKFSSWFDNNAQNFMSTFIVYATDMIKRAKNDLKSCKTLLNIQYKLCTRYLLAMNVHWTTASKKYNKRI